MKQYPAYPAYKTTGYDWFPEIPSHWRIDRAKWSVSSCQNGVWGAEPDGDDDLVCIRVADFDRQSLRVSTEKLTMRSIAEKDRRNRLLKAGDLLLEKSGGGEQQLVGAVVEFNQPFPAVTSNFIARMVASDGMNSRFLVYLHSHLYSGRVNFRSIKQTTGIQNLDSQAYLDEPITYPPLDEQQAIARFLDFKTAQIDALIAKKKSLLDKLAEKRTALISHAVTKGLDPLVPMKDSGVTWLGQIPSHWTALPLRRLIQTVKTGTTPAGVNEFHFSDSGVSWLRPGDFSDQIFIESAEKRLSDEGVAEVRVFPAFAVMHVGIGATIGKVGVTTEPSSCNQQINAIVCNERMHHLFAAYFLQAIREYIVKCGKYTTLPIINQDETKALCFTVPPVDEQIKISEYLLREEKLMEQQAKKIAQVIARLQEYRATLITNAVTGKIDVRGFEISQPAEWIAS